MWSVSAYAIKFITLAVYVDIFVGCDLDKLNSLNSAYYSVIILKAYYFETNMNYPVALMKICRILKSNSTV